MKAPKRMIKVLDIEGAPSDHDFNRAADKKIKGRYPDTKVASSPPGAQIFKGRRIGSIYGKRVGPIE